MRGNPGRNRDYQPAIFHHDIHLFKQLRVYTDAVHCVLKTLNLHPPALHADLDLILHGHLFQSLSREVNQQIIYAAMRAGDKPLFSFCGTGDHGGRIADAGEQVQGIVLLLPRVLDADAGLHMVSLHTVNTVSDLDIQSNRSHSRQNHRDSLMADLPGHQAQIWLANHPHSILNDQSLRITYCLCTHGLLPHFLFYKPGVLFANAASSGQNQERRSIFRFFYKISL